MKIICGLDRPSFFLFRMPWLRNLWIDAATAPFYIMFLLKINKRTVPALTCPYNYRHRMMTILFLLQAWHGYRWNSSCRKSVFQVCRDRLYVFDSGRFSWNLFLNCDSGFAFLFWTEAPFFSKKRRLPEKDSLKWLFFLRILIDKLGPYMCYATRYLLAPEGA